MQKFDAYQIAFQYLGHIMQAPPDRDFLTQTGGLVADLAKTGIFGQNQFPASFILPPDPAAAEAEIAASHLRLFSGPNPAAPPWESVWLERDKLLFGVKSDEVAAFYGDWGLEIANSLREPPDHIGYELGFLSYMLGLRNENSEALTAAANFLECHILKFADKILEAAKNDQCEYYPRHLEFMMAALDNLRKGLQA